MKRAPVDRLCRRIARLCAWPNPGRAAIGRPGGGEFIRLVLLPLIILELIGLMLPAPLPGGVQTALAEPVMAPAAQEVEPPSEVEDPEALLLERIYQDVKEEYAKNGYKPATETVEIDVLRYKSASPTGISIQTGVGGKQTPVLVWQGDETFVEWEFNVPTAGLYEIEVEYYPYPGARASIQRELRIDGELPFREAKRIVFERMFRDKALPKKDNQGNDVRPPQVEVAEWRVKRLEDAEALHLHPFQFYFSPGIHTIRMTSVREPIAIAAMRLAPPKTYPTYREYLEYWKARGFKETSGHFLKYEAEKVFLKNDPTIRAEACYDPTCTPDSSRHFTLNAFGGFRFRRPNMWATWEIEVPEDGFYKIALKGANWYAERMPVVRQLYIDGEIPFQEMEQFLIPYDPMMYVYPIGIRARPTDKTQVTEPYLFALTKGKHYLTLKVKIGPASDVVRTLDKTLREMSKLVREVILITGANPDPNMEWELDQKIPTLKPRLQAMSTRMKETVAGLERAWGYKPSVASVLLQMAQQFDSMIRDPDSIPPRLSAISQNQSALGTWLINLQQSPNWMDYFVVLSPDVPWPKAEANVLQRAWFSFKMFVASFINRYTGIGSIYECPPGGAECGEVLDVWVARGLEWGMILKEMIEDDFTPNTGIRVNLSVFPPGQLATTGTNVLLLALTAGQAPDVALAVDQSLPVEFAMRNAIVNLNQFPDYPEVAKRFRPGALVPFHYRGGDYALPETQDFWMLFYRTDILNSLKLRPPNTWDELYDILLPLQQNGLEFFYPAVGQQAGTAPGYTPFLFQNGGRYYREDPVLGHVSALDEPPALKAFIEWTDLYTNYRVQREANFFNRFRTGEMPIGISGYFTYVLLSTAAPELTGRWEMRPMPGRVQPDGSLDRSAGGTTTTMVILKQSKKQRAAWELLKWWSSADVQVRYGSELESLLGVEARWNTANVEGLQRLPWPPRDIASVLEQWRWFREQPVVVGGYFTGRHIVNAWNKVVLKGVNPREALEDAVKDINRELVRKQEEFGLISDPRLYRQRRG